MVTRRAFLRSTAATGVATFGGAAGVLGAKYDLVIRGGRVIDPARRLDARMDVAVTGGRIAGTVVKGRA